MTAKKFIGGQEVKCKGLDGQCSKTVEVVRFVKYNETPKVYGKTVFDCVTVSRDGVKVFSDSRMLLG